ncbi:MAG: hypothetical protein HY922_07305 [Elusimicrobia bacterium]|nr:hypothetical protein [Elusimicrobiota bacterium]
MSIPPGVIRQLPGFKSLCTKPLAWLCSMARAIWIAISKAVFASPTLREWSQSERLPPSMYSMNILGRPPMMRTKKQVVMCGWSPRPTQVLASWTKRSNALRFATLSSLGDLTASSSSQPR